MASSLQLLLTCLSLVVLVKAGLVPLDPPETRILGGHEIEIEQAPWQVSLQMVDGNTHFCGGVIISQDWVLTSAECVHDKSNNEFMILVGRKSVKSRKPYYHVEQVVEHPSFWPRYFVNDISLLKTQTKIRLSPRVRPVGLPIPGSPRLQVGTEVTLSGWGRMEDDSTTTLLRAAKFQVLDFNDRKCNYEFKSPETQLCLASGGKGSCFGDEGGPVVVDNLLVGIISNGGLSCGRGGTLATDVTVMRDWIRNKTIL